MLLLGPLTGPLCCAEGLCVMSSKSALKLLGLPNRGEALGLPAHKHVECSDCPGQRGIQMGTGTHCMTQKHKVASHLPPGACLPASAGFLQHPGPCSARCACCKYAGSCIHECCKVCLLRAAWNPPPRAGAACYCGPSAFLLSTPPLRGST